MSQSANVQVLVRCRPQIDAESGATCNLIDCDEHENVVRVQATAATDRCFEFNKVLGPPSQQEDVFEYASPLVDHALDGLHATIFAYGQTGSGKTHTMEGFDYQGGTIEGEAKLRPVLSTAKSKHGVIPRTIAAIFDRSQERMERSDRVRYKIKVSYFQIYNERVFDLLNPVWKKGRTTDQGGLRIRWGKGNTFYVENLFLYECDSAAQARELFQGGVKNKAMGSHSMNLQSSRSHSLFTMYIESWDPQQPECVIKSELTLVDLAGSEKLTMMSKNPSAKLLQESIEINASLLALGKVISALGGGKAAKQHVPYRDSKLTKLLKHSLGGNSLTLMIACISPCDSYVDESVSTLFYAGRAKNIRNDPRVNEDSKSSLIRALRAEIASLKTELQHYRTLVMEGAGAAAPAGKRGPSPIDDGRPRTAPDGGDSREAEYLGEKLVDSVKMLHDIIGVNAQLREAFDRITDLRSEAEAGVSQLNEENVGLRERIEMLESIVMQEDDGEEGGGGKLATHSRRADVVNQAAPDGDMSARTVPVSAGGTAKHVPQQPPRRVVPRGQGRKALEQYNRRYRSARLPAYEDYYGAGRERKRTSRPLQQPQAQSKNRQPRAFEGMRFKQPQPLFARPSALPPTGFAGPNLAAAPPGMGAGPPGLQAAAAASAALSGYPSGLAGPLPAGNGAFGDDFEARRRARAERAAQLEQQHRLLQQRRLAGPSSLAPALPRAAMPAPLGAQSAPAASYASPSYHTGAAAAAAPPSFSSGHGAPSYGAAPQPPVQRTRVSESLPSWPPTGGGFLSSEEARGVFSEEQLAIIRRRQTTDPGTGRFGL
eukprot:Hpha_TRINITY_DN15616_c4_g7::TRINITY_DN15616_c4_g7_i1::g.101733::m.101733